MKNILIAAAAAAALTAIAAPASAQEWRHHRYERSDWRGDEGIDARQADIQRRIHIAARRGALTPGELYRIRQEFRQIAWLENRYERNGLSARERQDLHRRLGHLEVVIAQERGDRDFAYGDRDFDHGDRDFRYGDRRW